MSKKEEEDFPRAKRRLSNLIIEATKDAPPNMAPVIKQSAPVLATVWIYFMQALPYIVHGISVAQTFLQGLPTKIIYAMIGFFICFFGGIFPATIAAVEAWRLCGGTEAIQCCQELLGEFQKVVVANKKDDDDTDVKNLSPKDLVLRKAALAVKTVDPVTINGGIIGLYTGWIGVLAILKIKFAKTITLGNVIGGYFYKIMEMYEPFLLGAVPQEYKKWVPVLLQWICKAVAISMAWWIQRVISAFHSAIRGGHMVGKHVVNYLKEAGILTYTSEQSYLDEAIGWVIAFFGLLFQFSMGFYVPFPLNLVSWPIQLLEKFIVWTVGS